MVLGENDCDVKCASGFQTELYVKHATCLIGFYKEHVKLGNFKAIDF